MKAAPNLFMLRLVPIICGCLLIALSGCREGALDGEQLQNQPPQTGLSIETVNLPDDIVFSSRVELTWWGTDPDGYVIGYEYVVNDPTSQDWSFTERTDSIFVLPISPGLDQEDVTFYVRAVDNMMDVDPEPARVTLPVKNSKPTIQISSTQAPSDTTYYVFSLGLQVDDPDGLESLQRVEIAFNDSTSGAGWVDVPLPEDESILLTGVIDSFESGDVTASMYLGQALSTPQEPITPTGLRLDAQNTLYARVTDQSGSVSDIASVSWYIKSKQSKVLLLHDDDSNQGQENLQEHLSYLQANGINPDVLTINDGFASGGAKVSISDAFPKNSLTRQRYLAQWDHIYWLSNSLDRNITYAQSLLGEFFSEGGTLFISIPTKSLESDDPLFQFLPFKELVRPTGIQNSFRLRSNSLVEPRILEDAAPTMTLSTTRLNLYPIIPSDGARTLYDASFYVQIITGQVFPYTEASTLIVESTEGNAIYAGINIADLDGQQPVSELVNYLCIQRLGFSDDE
jgi:hypothetical protein